MTKSASAQPAECNISRNTSNQLTSDMVMSIILKDGTGVFVVGEPVFLRTVTFHLTGRVIAIKDGFLVLDNAAWIPSDGRFMQAINDGALEEVEPVDVFVRVNISSIVDAYHWSHELPRKQK